MEIDHTYTKNIVCPYCGKENKNSWEVALGEEDMGIIDCGYCGEEFFASRIISIEYCTEKLEDE